MSKTVEPWTTAGATGAETPTSSKVGGSNVPIVMETIMTNQCGDVGEQVLETDEVEINAGMKSSGELATSTDLGIMANVESEHLNEQG